MSSGGGSRNRVVAIATREFESQVASRPDVPASRKFRGKSLALDKFDASWDRKRGAAMRMAAIVLREDDETLERRVCADARSCRDYTEAARWLGKEAEQLRKTARMHDTAAERLRVVIQRCAKSVSESTQEQ